MRSIKNETNLRDKKILLRLDLNVPLITLTALTSQKHNLVGGSADLAGSNNTKT